MIAVIAGATGLVGSELVLRLLDDSRVTQVVSLARRTLGIDNSKLKEVVVRDLDEMASRRTELKGDAYFCCLGTTIRNAGSRENFKKIDFEAVFDFGKIAKSYKAKSFSVITASGANARSRIFYSKVKGEAELSLRELDFPRLIIWRPGLLMGDRHEFRLSERLLVTIADKVRTRIPKKLAAKAVTDVDHLASRMASEGLESSSGITVFEASQI